MSHNVMVQGVIFDDVETLEAAFKELQQQNHVAGDAVFNREPFKMRGWNGRTESVDLGISLPSERYDIGFRKTENGLVPYFEHGFAPSGIAAEPGAQTLDGKTCGAHYGVGAIGKLAQRYRALQIERNARREGMMTRRVYKEQGKLAIEINHR